MEVDGKNIDSTAQVFGSGLIESGQETGQQAGQRYMQAGSEAGRGLLGREDNYNQGLAYGDRAISDAIKSKYMQQYGKAEKKLNTQVLLKADQDKVKELNLTSQLANEEVELNKQKDMLKWKKKQADKKARGNVLGTVLGITVGTVAGIYSGGSGAAAGYAAGNAAGQAIGSS